VTIEFPSKQRLEVHAAEKGLVERVRAKRIEQLIVTGLEHISNGLYGSSYEALAIGVDLNLEAHVNPPLLAEAASPKIGGLYKPARADGQANGYILPSSPRIRGKSTTDVYLGLPWSPQQ
jgi:hypothetical protein